jgi:hypothetical protein
MQDFCNTLDLEAGTDQLTGRDELAAWLAGHGLPAPGAAVAHEELEQALAVRAGLRELAMANAGQAVDEATVGRLNRALGPAALATIVVQAMHEGRWHRLKPLPRRRLPLAVLRPLDQPLGQLVHDGHLRQPAQGSYLSPPAPALTAYATPTAVSSGPSRPVWDDQVPSGYCLDR